MNSDGGVDPFFNPGANGLVDCLAMQADGKILVGGAFTMLGGKARTCLGRLNPDGSLDDSFAPDANGPVHTLVVQADGKILVGGTFTFLGGQSRTNLSRLNPNGTLDVSFDSWANDSVTTLAVQPDGKVLAGGNFSSLSGQPRVRIGRLGTASAALESLALNTNSTVVTWSRSGAGPEVEQVTFELSTDGANYTALGNGARLNGGWQFSGLSSSPGFSFYVRSRGRAIGGEYAGSSSYIESIGQFYRGAPALTGAALLHKGVFQFTFDGTGATNFTVLATTNLSLPASNWNALGPPMSLGDGAYQVSDPGATNLTRRFYRVRFP